MSALTEFQGSLDWHRDNKKITREDHLLFSDATRAAFSGEPDVAKKEILREKFQKLVNDGNWNGLRSMLTMRAPTKMTPGERRDFEAMEPEARAAHTRETGRS